MNTKLVAIMAIAVFASFGMLYNSADAALATDVSYSVSNDGTSVTVSVPEALTIHFNESFDNLVYATKVFPTSTSTADGVKTEVFLVSANTDYTLRTNQNGGAITTEQFTTEDKTANKAASILEHDAVTIVTASDKITLSNVGNSTKAVIGSTSLTANSEGKIIFSGLSENTTYSMLIETQIGSQVENSIQNVSTPFSQATIDQQDNAAAILERDAVTIVSYSSTELLISNVGNHTTMVATVDAQGHTATVVEGVTSGLNGHTTIPVEITTSIGTQTATKTITVTLVNNAAEQAAIDAAIAADLASAETLRDAVTHSTTFDSVTFSNIGTGVTVTFGAATMSNGQTASSLTPETAYTYTVSATVNGQTAATVTVSFSTPEMTVAEQVAAIVVTNTTGDEIVLSNVGDKIPSFYVSPSATTTNNGNGVFTMSTQGETTYIIKAAPYGAPFVLVGTFTTPESQIDLAANEVTALGYKDLITAEYLEAKAINTAVGVSTDRSFAYLDAQATLLEENQTEAERLYVLMEALSPINAATEAYLVSADRKVDFIVEYAEDTRALADTAGGLLASARALAEAVTFSQTETTVTIGNIQSGVTVTFNSVTQAEGTITVAEETTHTFNVKAVSGNQEYQFNKIIIIGTSQATQDARDLIAAQHEVSAATYVVDDESITVSMGANTKAYFNGVELSNGVLSGLAEETAYTVYLETTIGTQSTGSNIEFTTLTAEATKQLRANQAVEDLANQIIFTPIKGIGFSVSGIEAGIHAFFDDKEIINGETVASGAGTFTVEVRTEYILHSNGVRGSFNGDFTVIVEVDDKKKKSVTFGNPSLLESFSINGMNINVDRPSVKPLQAAQSSGETTFLISLGDTEGNTDTVELYIEQPTFEANTYASFTVMEVSMKTTTRDNTAQIMFSNEDGTQWQEFESDFKYDLGTVISAEILSVEETEVQKISSYVDVDMKGTKSTYKFVVNHNYDMEDANIYIITTDSYGNRSTTTVVDALTVEHPTTKYYEHHNIGCGKYQNVAEGEYKKCMDNPHNFDKIKVPENGMPFKSFIPAHITQGMMPHLEPEVEGWHIVDGQYKRN